MTDYPPGEHLRAHLLDLARVAEASAATLAGPVGELADRILTALVGGQKLMFCGNGGSAADAQHLATEYVVRFRRSGRPLAALALTTDTSLLTAAANDYGFEQIFARQVEGLGKPGDLLILHSTSGRSPNLLAAAEAARRVGIGTAALLAGDGGPLRDLVDVAILVPTAGGPHAQELHLAIGHAVCDVVEARLRQSAEDGGGRAALIDSMGKARADEKGQALFYRALAARAEEAGDHDAAERLNGLHADEQHHLSRLSARLLELGASLEDLSEMRAPAVALEDWEPVARERERAEVVRYERLLQAEMDPRTRTMLNEFLEAERRHAEQLGGKWMDA